MNNRKEDIRYRAEKSKLRKRGRSKEEEQGVGIEGKEHGEEQGRTRGRAWKKWEQEE